MSLDSLSSREITHGLAEFELDVAMTYVDDEELGNVRITPLYEERYLLLTPSDGRLAEREVVRWNEVAALPLCLLTRRMRNRRILDELFADAGVTTVPAIETNTVAALYAHVATHRWSSVIAHAWLTMFGIPAGMRVVPMESRRPDPRIGLVIADRDPEPILARTLLELVRDHDVRGALDHVLHRHLDR